MGWLFAPTAPKLFYCSLRGRPGLRRTGFLMPADFAELLTAAEFHNVRSMNAFRGSSPLARSKAAISSSVISRKTGFSFMLAKWYG